MMTGNDVEHLWGHLAVPFADIIRGAKNAEFINGSAAAIRKDHVLVGTTAGVGSRVVPYDYLVLSTGTRYQSDIKTEGASVEHRKASFAAEQKRMGEVSSFAIVGAGLVGIELAGDLKSYFPDKSIEVYTRSGAWLPRIAGAHERVEPVMKALGVNLVVGKEIVATDDEGRMVTKEGEKVGPAGARTYWCTGYKPNTEYLKDDRSDSAVAACLDGNGFVIVDKAMRLDPSNGLGHIFAGGDLVFADRHSYGERTAAMAWIHAGVIIDNIRHAAGQREGENLKMPAVNFYAGTDVAVSLGTNDGFMYATNPAFEMFFQDKEGLRAKHGEIVDSGVAGWQEVTKGTANDMGSINWTMFHMIPEGAFNMYTKDDVRACCLELRWRHACSHRPACVCPAWRR